MCIQIILSLFRELHGFEPYPDTFAGSGPKKDLQESLINEYNSGNILATFCMGAFTDLRVEDF